MRSSSPMPPCSSAWTTASRDDLPVAFLIQLSNSPRGMTLRSRSALRTRGRFGDGPRRKRAQGMPGAGCTHGPRASKKARGGYHRFSRYIRHSLRSGFNVSFVLSPGTGFLAPVPCDAGSVVTSATMRKRIARGISTGMPGPHGLAVRETSFVAAMSRGHRSPPPRS